MPSRILLIGLMSLTSLALPLTAAQAQQSDSVSMQEDAAPTAAYEQSSYTAPTKSVTPPSKELITEAILQELRNAINTDIVINSVVNQNKKYGDMTQLEINDLDQEWRTQRTQDNQPLIAATLSNPLSSYLTPIQAHSLGLYTEIFVMDANGLNVGQSNITSDYWQGDESKFQKTYPVSGTAIFIDEPELNEDYGNWRIQVNMAISDGEKAVGAVTVEINLTELQRRQDLGL